MNLIKFLICCDALTSHYMHVDEMMESHLQFFKILLIFLALATFAQDPCRAYPVIYSVLF